MSKIFLDGGNANETRQIKELLGFLDGQTTNPTLISKNPDLKGRTFSKQELLAFYKKVVRDIARLIPEGSVSVEVYADQNTLADDMLSQAREMFSWIPNAHIKFPINHEGLIAAEQAVKEGMRVNMTLCFTQEQAAAVYAATKSAKRGQVFVSPFVGRLDDKGENGMELVKNILQMFREGDGHVEVLCASVRNIKHFLYAFHLGSDIITSPIKTLVEWYEQGMPTPGSDYMYESGDLATIPYKELKLDKPWQNLGIMHPMTDQGIKKFSADWNALLQ